ncbi:MAG: HAD family hydrolase [Bacteroidales bacterium]
MIFIKEFLDNLPSIKPIPTQEKFENRLKDKDKIKAIIFDVYGTLIISASGDVHESEISHRNLDHALSYGNFFINGLTEEERNNITSSILHSFYQEIRNQQELLKKKNEYPFPEVEIRDVWKKVIAKAESENKIRVSECSHMDRMIFTYELLSNKIYPMPNLKETILDLQNKGYVLGIVSNAQFYTPIILNYFLNQIFDLDENILGFPNNLSVFSYQYGIGKPDVKLYNILTDSLEKNYHIKANESIFIGNDMLKDVLPAQKAGMQTALFAGDKRSLRLRREEKEVKNISPDLVITSFDQITKIF